MMQINDDRKQKVMQEIIENIKLSHTKLSYEMSIKDFADATGTSYAFAKKFLQGQVKNGKMNKRKITIDGKNFVVYSVI